MAALIPFTCPDCGLVIEASAEKGRSWLAEHRAFAHRQPAIAPVDVPMYATRVRESMTIETLRAIAQDLATGHKWRNTLTVDDAAFLHALEIDPT